MRLRQGEEVRRRLFKETAMRGARFSWGAHQPCFWALLAASQQCFNAFLISWSCLLWKSTSLFGFSLYFVISNGNYGVFWTLEPMMESTGDFEVLGSSLSPKSFSNTNSSIGEKMTAMTWPSRTSLVWCKVSLENVAILICILCCE